MFLIKCKCGCFFTIKEENIDRTIRKCHNCGEEIPFNHESSLEKNGNILQSGLSISRIPDDAKITVEFNT